MGGIKYGSLLAIAGGGSGGGVLPGVTVPLVSFTVGDGQAGTPANNSTVLAAASIQGQSIVDKQLLVIRGGIPLLWDSAVEIRQIRRYNSAGLGGFSFEAASGLYFATGDQYDIYITGVNSTTQI